MNAPIQIRQHAQPSARAHAFDSGACHHLGVPAPRNIFGRPIRKLSRAVTSLHAAAPPDQAVDQQHSVNDSQNLHHGLLNHIVPYGKPTAVHGDGDSIPCLWQKVAASHPTAIALEDPHKGGGITVTFGELWKQMQQLAAGLRALGLQAGEKVSLFSENSSRWIVADQAIMLNGCADSVRGSTAPYDELAFILGHSSSTGLVVQDVEALRKVAPALQGEPGSHLKFVMVLWGSDSEVAAEKLQLGLPAPLPVLSYEEVMALGLREQQQQQQQQQPFQAARLGRADLATLVYTSGTTGHPKAVMLTHGNLLYQVENLSHFLPVSPGDSTLSLLPPWHIYERATSYYILSAGARQVFSNIRKFKDDLPAFTPDYFVCVPLVLETLHSKVMHNFRTMQPLRKAIVQTLLAASTAYVRACRVVAGTALQYALKPRPAWALVWAVLLATVLKPIHAFASKLVYSKVRQAVGIRQTVVSGGSSLAPHLDDFYEVLGLEVLNGWGLSETSPVLACRRAVKNVRGSIGEPTPGTQIRVVHPETLQDLPDGEAGLLLARGPGVMQGYMNDAAATAKAFRAGDGWFDTGDLGWRAPAGVAGSSMAGVLVLTGRAKDTIVLSCGKNVEPEPIEGAVSCSPLIKHVVLLGTDKRELGALVFPDQDALDALAQQQQAAAPLSAAQLQDLMLAEVNKFNATRADYHPFDHVAHVVVASSPLSVEDGTLTRTMKPRRPEIYKRYAAEVQRLMMRLRG